MWAQCGLLGFSLTLVNDLGGECERWQRGRAADGGVDSLADESVLQALAFLQLRITHGLQHRNSIAEQSLQGGSVQQSPYAAAGQPLQQH